MNCLNLWIHLGVIMCDGIMPSPRYEVQFYSSWYIVSARKDIIQEPSNFVEFDIVSFYCYSESFVTLWWQWYLNKQKIRFCLNWCSCSSYELSSDDCALDENVGNILELIHTKIVMDRIYTYPHTINDSFIDSAASIGASQATLFDVGHWSVTKPQQNAKNK